MPDRLSPDQQALRQRVGDFVRSLSPDVSVDAVRAASKAAGLYYMTQPAAFGGSEAGALELTIVRDELGAHGAPHSQAILGPGPGVLAGVPEPLRSRYLDPLVAGEKRGAFAFTEPDDAPPTRGVRVDEWLVINGKKSYVTGGAEADFINTLVHVADEGPALVVIDRDSPGVTMDKTFNSLDGSHHAAFSLDDVKVPADNIIGAPGEGLPRAMRQIGDTRLAIAGNCVGTMRWILDFLEDHLRTEDRNGQRRGDKEGVRLRFADQRITAFAARSMVYRTARLADNRENVVNESIACKVFATEAVQRVVDTAIQLVGGAALTEEHPLARLYRQVRVLRLAEGANDVLRLNLARGRLELGKGTL